MRKLYITLFLVLINTILHLQAFAQSPTGSNAKAPVDTSHKQLIRTAANLKSGTSQDVLTSFFKLAYSDLSDGHHFQFNSSLFAVRAKTDTTLWLDINYKKQTFARNLTFGIDYGLDSNYKFKSASFNLKYAIINERDKSIFDFSYGKQIGLMIDNASLLVSDAEQLYFKRYPERFAGEHVLIGNFLTYKKKTDKTPIDKLPPDFKKILDSLAKTNRYSPITLDNYPQARDSVTNLYTIASSLLAKRILWTVGSQITANQQKLFNKVNINTELLKGITNNYSSMGAEIDAKANLNFYDTTAVNQNYQRKIFSASLGINWIIYKDKKTQKSYVEFKPALAYNNVLGGQLSAETQSKFTGDGVLRFRVTDDLWIPIDIKYDPKQGRFFGFINITSNFDWLGANKSSGSTKN